MTVTSFDPEKQIISPESKIVVALERISEAFRVLLWNESKQNALSPIQIQILLFLQFHPRELSKISYLATEFNMTKATISDSVRVLVEKELIEKVKDENDSRSFNLFVTTKGQKIVNQVAGFSNVMEQPISKLSQQQKEVLLLSLIELITKLDQQGIITVQRMCNSCRFYKKTDTGHFCNFLQQPLQSQELRIDCPEHVSHN
ncbi:MarR family winged helix-turn-helix transcriptional regulator [Membranihabitans maritimus]|uniref:MarR family winged helix-turn-helix transcriptional regulator n=1 Tax=Membranihabitans maritimus TaxID=2904244 RepID=UPI001F45BE20|nr:MarR family winged helix-turn-helix transcriptional regulator [Membranihabitans maritimus]